MSDETNVSRGAFIKRAAWGVSVLAACIFDSQKSSAETTRDLDSKQPNILWITTDDQRIDALGCYGSRWGLSPHLDALASRGVRVEQCIVQSVNCNPSRAALWTGLYPSKMGRYPYVYNVHPRPAQAVPLIRGMRQSGYQMAHFGKLDYPRLSFEFDISKRMPAPGGAIDAFGSGIKDESFLRVPATGILVGGINPKSYKQTLTGLLANRAERFLEKEAKPPFFMRVSFNVPHTPWIPHKKYYGAVDRSKIRLSYPTQDELATKPQREVRHIRPMYGFDGLDREQLDYARGCYYDLCVELDAGIGRILDALQRHEFGGNTIVVLTSDHGTTLGEHGVGTKRTFYESVVRSPMIWAWPGHLPAGTTLTDPVELFDLLPTLRDLIGMDPIDGIQARSIAPQLLGRSRNPNRAVFTEFDTSLSPIGGPWVPKEARWHPKHDRRIMVRHGGWKLECNYGPSDYGEDGALYDLEQDPKELVNLFDDAGHQQQVQRLQKLVRDRFEVH